VPLAQAVRVRPVRSVDYVRAAYDIELKPAPKAVLIALCDCVDAQSALAWPSVQRLERMTGWSERTVQQALHVLTREGLIKARGRTYGGRGNTTRWEVLITPASYTDQHPAQESDHPEKGAGAAPITDGKGAGAAPFDMSSPAQRVQVVRQRVQESARLLETHQDPDPPRTRVRAREGQSESAAPTGPAAPVAFDLASLSPTQRAQLREDLRRLGSLPGPLAALEPELRAELEAEDR